MLRIFVVFSMLLALTAGCAGDASREDFEEQVLESRDRTDAALEFITQAQTFDELINRIRLASAASEAAADDLDEVGAPDELAEQGDELSDALHDLGEELEATADGIDSPEFEGSTVQGLEFRNWVRVNRVLESLREQGIEVAPLERH
jgi:hypothetical protein